MKRKSIKAIAALLCLATVFSLSACGSDNSADLVIRNGMVYTADGKGTVAEAIAVNGDEIVYVGDEQGVEKFIKSSTKDIDMNGGMVLPGFTDSHQHPSAMANELFMVSLLDCKSDEEYIETIKEYYQNNPDVESIVGAGWDRPLFDSVKQTKETLDEISAEIPIVMSDSGYHMKWMNSKALEMMGINKDSEVPEGAMVEKNENGEPTGVVSDYPGISDKFNQFTKDQYKEAILAYQEEALACGLTGSFEDTPSNFDRVVEAYNELESEGKLKYRVNAYMRISKDDDIEKSVAELKSYSENNNDGLFRVDGAKIFIDGVLEGETAYMEEAYANNPENYGQYRWKGATDRLNELCRLLEKEGLNYHFHAIGDKAVAIALDAIEYAKANAKDSVTRPGITHLQFVNEKDIKRFKELGVSAVIQAFWAGYDEYYEQSVELLGKSRADRQYPIESLFKEGVLVASGSDFPVQTDRPLIAIEMGVTRAFPGETKSLPEDKEKAKLEDMILSYTLNGAIANGRENETGSIEIGKKADLVVLDKNLFEIPAAKIAETKETVTIFNGEVVYEKNAKN